MSHKIIVLMLYSNCPVKATAALKSIVEADRHYVNWRLAFHDNNSSISGESIVRDTIPKELMKRVSFYRSWHSPYQKSPEETMLGLSLNQMLLNSDADLAFVLRDTDAIHSHYLSNLNEWYTNNLYEQASYCQVVPFDPDKETYLESHKTDHPLNRYNEPIYPAGKINLCQFSWRTRANKMFDIKFPYPSGDFGYEFMRRFSGKMGEIRSNEFYGVYRAAKEGAIDEAVSLYLQMAKGNFLAGEFSEGLRLFEDVLRMDPGNDEATQMIQEYKTVVPAS